MMDTSSAIDVPEMPDHWNMGDESQEQPDEILVWLTDRQTETQVRAESAMTSAQSPATVGRLENELGMINMLIRHRKIELGAL